MYLIEHLYRLATFWATNFVCIKSFHKIWNCTPFFYFIKYIYNTALIFFTTVAKTNILEVAGYIVIVKFYPDRIFVAF
jgi:hypothetical protein